MNDWCKYTRKEYSVTQAAYLAGIIDGEGCIFIGNYSRNKSGDKFYQTLFTVATTSEELAVWLQDNFGGLKTIYTHAQTPKNSRKTVHRWVASGDRLTHLCEVILPYIVIKKREVEIMMQMRETFDKYAPTKGQRGRTKLSKEDLEIRQKLFDELKSIHTRHPKNP